MLDNNIPIEDARQGISSYSCGECASKQERHNMLNITGNASEHNEKYIRDYVDNLWILVGNC